MIFRRFSRQLVNLLTRNMSAEILSSRIIWVDLEMTGLDVSKEKIIEAACAVTDAELNIIAKGPSIIIHETDEVLDNMNEWCIKQHGQSGLTEASRKSNISVSEAEAQLLSFVQLHTSAGQCPLAGNSVHADKKFLEKYMPEFTKHLHYRIIDVSTVKELCRRWYPEDFKKAPVKKICHRALDDIEESILEMKYYQKEIFKSR